MLNLNNYQRKYTVGPFLDQETKTRTRSGLGTGLGSAVIQTPTVTQTPIQTPITNSSYPTSTSTKVRPSPTTPIIPYIPTPITS